MFCSNLKPVFSVSQTLKNNTAQIKFIAYLCGLRIFYSSRKSVPNKLFIFIYIFLMDQGVGYVTNFSKKNKYCECDESEKVLTIEKHHA